MDIHGLAFALAGGREPTPEQVEAAEASARRLIGTSLLTPLLGDQVWVHRWTAQELRRRLGEEGARECARRAGEYRAWRVANVSHSLSDGIEAARRFLEAAAFDRAVEMAWPILDFMGNYGQLVDVAGFAAEVLEGLPAEHRDYPVLCGTEADALQELGATDRAMSRYRDARRALVRLARTAPERGGLLFSLATVHERIGNLYQSSGEILRAQKAFRKSLGIRERLARAEPERADYQRDLSVSYNNMGDLYRALGQGEAAREASQQSLEIGERLARAEPERADYQWDLVVSLLRIADFDGERRAAHLGRALAILRALDAAGRLVPQQRDAMAQLEAMLEGKA